MPNTAPDAPTVGVFIIIVIFSEIVPGINFPWAANSLK